MTDNGRKPETLDLSALAPPRDTLKLPNGKSLEFARMDDFGIVHMAKAQRILDQIQEVQGRAVEDEAAGVELVGHYRRLVGMVLIDSTPEDIADLSEGQLARIAAFFTERLPKEVKAAVQSTTASSSPTSPRPTRASRTRNG